MALSAQTQTQTARSTTPQKIVTPDFIAAAKKADDVVLSKAEKNPVYGFIFEGNLSKEQRIEKVVAYLTTNLTTAKPEDLDERSTDLSELNAAIQVLRRQLASDQAKEITSKAYADFQRIVNETSADVGRFQDELAPLCQLAELFSTYGADGNLIEKINQAKLQKKARETRAATWWAEHERELVAYRRSISEIEAQIKVDQTKFASAWIGGNAIKIRIQDAEANLAIRQQELAAAQAKTLDTEAPVNDVTAINEEILGLQDIGGEKFKLAITELRDHTEEALAKISINFDEAVTGLTNARESFIAMDRNCGDATFALSILEVAVRQAETVSRTVAETSIAAAKEVNPADAANPLADLDRMEREQRGEQILRYTSSLTTFLKDVGVAVASLRSGKSVIQSILRMNAMALESANTHKITGIANTGDAVTITIGSIIEVCNRAASRALADALSSVHATAQAGSERLIKGSYESLGQQNEQLGEFVESVVHLKQMTSEISANTIGMLKDQFNLVKKMSDESAQLGAATTESQQAAFNARAGVGVMPEATEADKPTRRFGRMGQ